MCSPCIICISAASCEHPTDLIERVSDTCALSVLIVPQYSTYVIYVCVNVRTYVMACMYVCMYVCMHKYCICSTTHDLMRD